MLSFMEANADVGITIKKIANRLEDIRFVVMTDAAWGVRPDGTSQGGFAVMTTTKDVFAGKVAPYVFVDWRSWKLPRISRSSVFRSTGRSIRS